jgi:hypothetical protein
MQWAHLEGHLAIYNSHNQANTCSNKLCRVDGGSGALNPFGLQTRVQLAHAHRPPGNLQLTQSGRHLQQRVVWVLAVTVVH